MAYHSRRNRLEFLLGFTLLYAASRPGIYSFSVASLRWPRRATCSPRYPARRSATTGLRASDGNIGEPPFSSVEDLEALTVVRLKSELKARGMKQTGKKADLVRLLANTPGVLAHPPPAEAFIGKAPVDDAGGGVVEDPPFPPASPREASTHKAQHAPPSSSSTEGVPDERRTFSSPTEAEFASGIIMDAELATRPGAGIGGTASLVDEGGEEDLDMNEDDYSSSSAFGDGVHDPAREGHLPNGFHRINQPPRDRAPATPQLPPPPTEDMRRRAVILDQMERRQTTFALEKTIESSSSPRSDVYIVSTKQALRPWDGPHAHRAETHVVILLSDVLGWGDSFTRRTADEVADMCEAIVLVPDMFRNRPWDHQQPEEGYEAWRASHDPVTVAADIRACVEYAKSEYKPTSLALMGFCFGGGKALEEAAAGVIKPDSLVVFYPTRYDIDKVTSTIACPVAAFFAEYDALPGATVRDAHSLREKLLLNDQVPDVQVKLCPGAGHGFAHRPMRRDKENAEDAMLLATSWLGMYMQKHFAVQPGGVKQAEFGFWELPAKEEVV